MKTASIELFLSKDQSVIKHNVTAIEVLLLTAEHHQSVGKEPVIVDKKSIKENEEKRSLDQEFDRLRGIYGGAKVQMLMNAFKEFPDDFDKASANGVKITLRKPGIATISTTTLA